MKKVASSQHNVPSTMCEPYDDIEKFRRWLVTSPVKVSTRRAYLSRLNCLVRFARKRTLEAERDSSLDAIIAEFMLHLRQQHLATQTVRNFVVLFMLMSRFFSRSLGEQQLDSLPPFRHKPLSEAELEALIEAAKRQKSKRDLVLVFILLSTEVRLIEIARLEVDDINLEDPEPFILVRPADTLSLARSVPIDTPLVAAMQAWLLERRTILLRSEPPISRFLFPGTGGGAIRPASLEKAIRHLGHRAKLCICTQRLTNTFFKHLRDAR